VKAIGGDPGVGTASKMFLGKASSCEWVRDGESEAGGQEVVANGYEATKMEKKTGKVNISPALYILPFKG